MAKISKRMKAIAEKVQPGKLYAADDAFSILKSIPAAKFRESVDVAVNLGVDPRKSDQVVRGSTVLPNGTGQSVRVAVFTQGANAEAAKAAGAEIVGMDDLAESIKAGNMDFDVVIASPDAMRVVGQLGQILGPRGLMPNPKAGTVTPNVAEAVKNAKAGQVRYRTDKAGIIHCTIGKVDFRCDGAERKSAGPARRPAEGQAQHREGCLSEEDHRLLYHGAGDRRRSVLPSSVMRSRDSSRFTNRIGILMRMNYLKPSITRPKPSSSTHRIIPQARSSPARNCSLSLISVSEWGVTAVTDEIYEHILYDGARHISITSLPGMKYQTITINSVSNTYSLTGWRVGWAIAAQHLTASIRKVHDFLTVGAPHPLQEAAAEALRIHRSFYETLAREYGERRDFLLSALKDSGFHTYRPGGAYYIMTDVGHSVFRMI